MSLVQSVDSGDSLRASVRWERFARWAANAALPAVFLATFAAYQFRLDSVLIADMDEGAYLYQGRLIAQGLVPYRDFFAAHPPLVPLFGTLTYALFGDSLAAARALYAIVALALAVPVALVVRRQTSSAAAGALAFATYAAGMLAVANMGRTVRLEPIMAGLLLSAFSLTLARGDSTRHRALAGGLMALALLAKLTAVIPIALFAAFELFEARRELWSLLRPWGAQLLGAAAVLVPTLGYLLTVPGFVDSVWTLQSARPSLTLELRVSYFANNLVRFPPLAVGLVTAAYYLWRPPGREVRAFAWLSISGIVILVLIMPVYLRYYVVQLMPYVSIVFACAVWSTVRAVRPALTSLALSAATVLAVLAMLAYAEVYHRAADFHGESAARVVDAVRASTGSVYSMYPAYSLTTGRPLTPWYYMADSLLPRMSSQIGDDEFTKVFASSGVLVLWPGEIDAWPRARALVERDFRMTYYDDHWIVWERVR